MTERPLEIGQGAAPRDMAALYSQAQMKFARYGHFSASRQQVRGQFSQLRPFAAEATEVASFPAKAAIAEESALDAQPAPRETGSTRRWYALSSVLFPSQAPVEAPSVSEGQDAGYPPMVVVVSSAGGVGKTCLVATLGRALAAVGEQVLLADKSPCGLLPFYFASREIKPGVVRTFASPVQSGHLDAPVRVLSLRTQDQDQAEADFLTDPLLPHVRGASRVLLDSGLGHRPLPRQITALRPTLLAPILPDMSSLACLAWLEDLVGIGGEIYYVLNQFDASLPLHLDIRAMLQQQLGGRLLPMVLHRSPAVSEALAEGMTVIDYAPGLDIAEDYRQLAAWVRSLAAPAPVSHGSLRWTER